MSAAFEFLYFLNKDDHNVQAKFLQYPMVFLPVLQFLHLVIHPQWKACWSDWMENLLELLALQGLWSEENAGYVFFSWLAFGALFCSFVVWARNKFEGQDMGFLSKPLHFLLTLSFTILVYPISLSSMWFWKCRDGTDCWQGQHLTWSLAGMLLFVLYCVAGILFSGVIFPSSSDNIGSRVHGRLHIAWFCTQLIASIAMVFLDNAAVKVVFLLLISSFSLYLGLKFMVYRNKSMNSLYCASWAVALWLAASTALFELQGDDCIDEASNTMTYAGVFVAATLGWLAVEICIHWTLAKPINTIRDIYQLELKERVMLASLKDATEAEVAAVKEQIQSAYDEFIVHSPNGLLFVFAARFYAEVLENPHMSAMRQSQALHHSPPLDVRYALYEMHLLGKLKHQFDYEMEDTDARVEFERVLEQANVAANNALSHELNFWKACLERVPNIALLYRHAKAVHTHAGEAEFCFQRLLKISPQSSSSMRKYGAFVVDVLNDAERGNEMQQMSDKIAARVLSESDNYVMFTLYERVAVVGGLSLMDDRNAVVTISTEEGGSYATISDANSCAVKLFGWPSNRMIGSNVAMLFPDPLNNQFEAFLHTFVSSGNSAIIGTTRTLFARHNEGHSIPVMVTFHPVTASHSLILVFRRLDKAKDFLLVSHKGQILNGTSQALEFFSLSASHVQQSEVMLEGWISDCKTVLGMAVDSLTDLPEFAEESSADEEEKQRKRRRRRKKKKKKKRRHQLKHTRTRDVLMATGHHDTTLIKVQMRSARLGEDSAVVKVGLTVNGVQWRYEDHPVWVVRLDLDTVLLETSPTLNVRHVDWNRVIPGMEEEQDNLGTTSLSDFSLTDDTYEDTPEPSSRHLRPEDLVNFQPSDARVDEAGFDFVMRNAKLSPQGKNVNRVKFLMGEDSAVASSGEEGDDPKPKSRVTFVMGTEESGEEEEEDPMPVVEDRPPADAEDVLVVTEDSDDTSTTAGQSGEESVDTNPLFEWHAPRRSAARKAKFAPTAEQIKEQQLGINVRHGQQQYRGKKGTRSANVMDALRGVLAKQSGLDSTVKKLHWTVAAIFVLAMLMAILLVLAVESTLQLFHENSIDMMQAGFRSANLELMVERAQEISDINRGRGFNNMTLALAKKQMLDGLTGLETSQDFLFTTELSDLFPEEILALDNRAFINITDYSSRGTRYTLYMNLNEAIRVYDSNGRVYHALPVTVQNANHSSFQFMSLNIEAIGNATQWAASMLEDVMQTIGDDLVDLVTYSSLIACAVAFLLFAFVFFPILRRSRVITVRILRSFLFIMLTDLEVLAENCEDKLRARMMDEEQDTPVEEYEYKEESGTRKESLLQRRTKLQYTNSHLRFICTAIRFALPFLVLLMFFAFILLRVNSFEADLSLRTHEVTLSSSRAVHFSRSVFHFRQMYGSVGEEALRRANASLEEVRAALEDHHELLYGDGVTNGALGRNNARDHLLMNSACDHLPETERPTCNSVLNGIVSHGLHASLMHYHRLVQTGAEERFSDCNINATCRTEALENVLLLYNDYLRHTFTLATEMYGDEVADTESQEATLLTIALCVTGLVMLLMYVAVVRPVVHEMDRDIKLAQQMLLRVPADVAHGCRELMSQIESVSKGD